MAYTTVTETLSCWVPGEIGTEEEACGAAAEPAADRGKGGEGAWSVMLTTGPRGWPKALAY